MKCPKCNTDLRAMRVPTRLSIEQSLKFYCPSCKKELSEKEIKDILDAEKIEEDTQTWKETKEIQRRLK